MLIDSELISVRKRAENGDPKALFDFAIALLKEGGVKHSWRKVKEVYEKLATFDPEEIDFISYGALLTFIGDIEFDSRNYLTAEKWYQKALCYIEESYNTDYAKYLIDDLKIKKSIKDCILKRHYQGNKR